MFLSHLVFFTTPSVFILLSAKSKPSVKMEAAHFAYIR